MFVATLLAHHLTPSVFALDNVDGTLNPRLVRRLSKHMIDILTTANAGSKSQAFMTSHHPSSLDSFDIFDPAQRIFVCRRSEDRDSVIGRTVFFPLVPPADFSKEKWNITHHGKNLSELLLDNRIPGAL